MVEDMAKGPRGRLIGTVSVGKQGGFRGFQAMMKEARRSVKILRKTGQPAYMRGPKRTKSGYEVNIFEPRK